METKRKSIIFCDDNKIFGPSIKSQMIKYVNVDLAYNLGDLVDKLKNEKYHFDLVICDIELPSGEDSKVVKDLEIVDIIRKVYPQPKKLYMISTCRCENEDLKRKLLNNGVNEVFFGGIGVDIGHIESKIKLI